MAGVRRTIAVTAGAIVALLVVPLARAHVVAMPGFLPSQGTKSISLDVPNEREQPMTSFVVTAPSGLAILHAHSVAGWEEEATDSTATWTGGSLAANAAETFGVALEADVDPGIVELEAEQRYGDGGVVKWPVSLTVTPAEDTPSQNLALAGVVGLIGLLVVGAVAMLALRRRPARD